MIEDDLEAANRALLCAIEAAPPEASVEDRLDHIAATTWHYARETERAPDPGRMRHLECKLAALERTTAEGKRWHVERARACLRRYAARLESV
jgi:hypothetical protein